MGDGAFEEAVHGLDAARRAGWAQMYDERRRADHAERQWGLWEQEATRLREQLDRSGYRTAYDDGFHDGQWNAKQQGVDRADTLRPHAAAALVRLEMEHLPLRGRVNAAITSLREGLGSAVEPFGVVDVPLHGPLK